MNTEGFEKVKQIREKEEAVSRLLEEAKRKCMESVEEKKAEFESKMARLTHDLQVKSDLALREKEAQFQRDLDDAISQAKEEAEKMKLKMEDKELVDRVFKIMEEYLSE